MKVGDLVVRKSYSKDITFKIIDIKENEEGITYILKGLHIRIIADSKGEDLEKVEDDFAGDKDKSFDSKMNDIIKKVILSREQKNNQLTKDKIFKGCSLSDTAIPTAFKFNCLYAFKQVSIYDGSPSI